MEGWIKIHRKILDNPIICKDAETFVIWVYLLLNATRQDIPALFKGKKITLKKGQLITGRNSIGDQLNISSSKVQRVLTLFEEDRQIEQQMSNQNRLISILNWDKYQKDEQPLNNEWTTNEQQVDSENITAELDTSITDFGTNQKVNTNKKTRRTINNYIYGQTVGQENIFDNADVEFEEIKNQKWEKQFEEFYNVYPRKVKKQDVKKWFERNKPSNELFSSMMNSLEQFRASKDWQKDGGQYIPYPSTWLNQKRWEDEEIKLEIKTKETQKNTGGRQTC